MKFSCIWPRSFWEDVWNCRKLGTWIKSQCIIMTFCTVLMNPHVLMRMTVSFSFHVKIFNHFRKILCSRNFLSKSRKRSRSTKVIVWTALEELRYPLNRTKCQDHRPIETEKEAFKRFCFRIWARQPCYSTWPFELIFVPKSLEAVYKKWVTFGPVAFEKMFDTAKFEKL